MNWYKVSQKVLDQQADEWLRMHPEMAEAEEAQLGESFDPDANVGFEGSSRTGIEELPPDQLMEMEEERNNPDSALVEAVVEASQESRNSTFKDFLTSIYKNRGSIKIPDFAKLYDIVEQNRIPISADWKNQLLNFKNNPDQIMQLLQQVNR